MSTTPELAKILDAAIARGASDLHLKAGAAPLVRVHGSLEPVGLGPVSEEGILALLEGVATPSQMKTYRDTGNLDFAVGTPGGRFRLNVFRQRGLTSVAVRYVHQIVKGFEELHLPKVLGDVCTLSQGMVIVAGITGSGKSTTLAAMIEHINARERCHIVTIEDPIEYVYEDRLAYVNQREIGVDVEDFRTALRFVVREDPDVILIGEMRDEETISAALSAAETGHLVFGTLHTSSAAQTLDRVLSFYPRERHRLMRHSIAHNVKAVVCQQLVPSCRPELDRVPAVEIMLMSPIMRKLILDEDDTRLPDAIRVGREEGMQDFTESFRQLVEKDLVDRKVAFERAPNAESLRMALKGIVGGETGLLGKT